MAVNKLALIRYKTIDECLRNHRRKWTLEDLIEKVSNMLYEYEGITSGVSKRTIQADIQLMRSNKLGYNAPIIVKDRKYYTYAHPAYSIANTPIGTQEIEKIKEAVDLLKQLNGFNYFDEITEIVTKLENNLYKSTDKRRNYIQFEGNGKLRGLEHINSLYQAIHRQQSLLIEYKSFKAENAQHQIYYPYLLKEYRNRWFLIARPKKGAQLITLALDRIIQFQELPYETFIPYEGVDFDRYYADIVGVTKNPPDRAQKIILWIDSKNAPYVLTKPIHQSQQVLKADDGKGLIIRIDVVPNFELERELLGFGECIKILTPKRLETRIHRRLVLALRNYEKDPTTNAP